MSPVGIFGRLTYYRSVNKRPRDDHGRLGGNAYEDSEFFEAIADQELPTTVDVAEVVGCSRKTAYQRLTALEDEGQLENRQIGKALVWSVAD